MVISELGINKTLNRHCPGHITVRGSQLASEGWYFCRVKHNIPYLGGGSSDAAYYKFEMFLHNAGPIFFNICGWAFIRGLIFWEICLKNQHFWRPNWGMGLY